MKPFFAKYWQESLLVFCLFVFYWWYCYPVSFLFSENINVVAAIDTDEVYWLRPIMEVLNGESDHVQEFCYGHFYYNIGFAIIKFLKHCLDISEQNVLLIFRNISAFFYLLNAFLVYQIGKKFFSKIIGILGFFLMLFHSLDMSYYATNLHPDTAQLTFVLLFMYYLLRFLKSEKTTFFLLAFLFAGIAFSTKYVGIMFLPILFVAVLFKDTKKIKNSFWINILFGVIGVLLSLKSTWLFIFNNFDLTPTKAIFLNFITAYCILVITLAFLFKHFFTKFHLQNKMALFNVGLALFASTIVVFSYESFIHFRFIDGITAVSNEILDQDLGKTLLNKLYNSIIEERVYSVWLLILFLLSLIPFFNKINQYKIVLIGWVILYVGYLLYSASNFFPHYFMLITPFVYLIIGIGIEDFISRIRLNNYKKGIQYVVFLIMIGVSFVSFANYKKERIVFLDNSAELKAGNWIQENLNKNKVLIIADRYTYIPKQYPHNKFWFISDETLKLNNYNYLVLSARAYNQVLEYNGSDDKKLKSKEFYKNTLENKNKNLKLVKDFGNVKIYKIIRSI